MRYVGKVYRALNPVWACQPLSGEGAALYGGRFNAKRTPALYTALQVLTAVREANQVGHLQPTTLVCLDVDLDPVFDCRDAAALARYDMSVDGLAAPGWREEMREQGRSATQMLADRLMADGFVGLLVRSFVRGATADDLNLVIWRWSDGPLCRVTLVDDENRLGSHPKTP